MTVPTETSRVTFAGNGVTTSFATGFVFLDAGTVRVTLTSGGVDTVLIEGIHYSVTQPAGEGSRAGTVVMVTAPAVGQTLTVERDVALTQSTSFRTQGAFSPSVHEDQMDRIVFEVQELKREMGDIVLASSSALIAAGSGLTSSGASPVTLHVGAGPGVIVGADDVQVAFGTTPSLIGVGSDAGTPDKGVEDLAARVDHAHVAITAAAGTIAVGDTSLQGGSLSLSRADHRHALPAPAAPADVTKAAASAGVATTVARSDHKHDISTGSAVELTDSSNTEGGATSLARSNHTHAHGNRGGGSLHALAVTGGASGFMSGAHALALDNIGTVFSAKTHVRAYQTSAKSVPNGGAVMTFDAEEYDTQSEFNPATGIFTATEDGYYLVTAAHELVSTAWAAGKVHPLSVSVSGVNKGGTHADFFDGAITRNSNIALATVVKVLTGQTIRVDISQNNGAAINSGGTSSGCFITIDRLL